MGVAELEMERKRDGCGHVKENNFHGLEFQFGEEMKENQPPLIHNWVLFDLE